jgi:hypothetical protein
MTNWNHVTSKFYRLKLSDDILSLLEQLPIRQIKETPTRGLVYLGTGQIDWGASVLPMKVVIWQKQKQLFADLKIPGANIHVTHSFDTSEQKKQTAEAFRKAISFSWN